MKNRRKSEYFLNGEDKKDFSAKKDKPEPRSKYRSFFSDKLGFRNLHHEYFPGFNYNQHHTATVKFMANEPNCKITTPYPLVISMESTMDDFDKCLERPRKLEEFKFRHVVNKTRYTTLHSKYSEYLISLKNPAS